MIDSSGAINIIRNALRLIDERLINHMERTAYIYFKMLQSQNKYSNYELKTFFLIGLFHDLGAYKTDNINDLLDFDFKDVWAHSIYGYLYLKYLSPFEDFAQILLYHHVEYDKFKNSDIKYRREANYLSLADKFELLITNGMYNKEYTERFVGNTFSKKGLKLFDSANKKYKIGEKLIDGSYKEELDEIIKTISLSFDKNKKLLELMIFSVDFKDEGTVVRSTLTWIISSFIAEKLDITKEDIESMNYAACVYDLGMLGIPSELLDAPRKLSDEEKSIMQQHVQITDNIINGHVPESVRQMAFRHHEKLDNTGYPLGIGDKELTSTEKIFIVSDIMAALLTKKNHKEAFTRKEVVNTLSKEMLSGKIWNKGVDCIIQNYSELEDRIQLDTSNFLKYYSEIKMRFESIMKKFEGV